MTYYEDLTPYSYSETEEKYLNVGWLSPEHAYVQGDPSDNLIESLKELARSPCNVFRGIHFCELCPSFDAAQEYVHRDGLFLGSGEIRIHSSRGVNYAAPVMIVHYIEVHQYLPPEEFVRAALEYSIT